METNEKQILEDALQAQSSMVTNWKARAIKAEADSARLRTILRATVNVTDLLAAGYSVDEANKIVGEFGE